MERIIINRLERYSSHILLDLRRYRWWPFSGLSAIILDLHEKGFKAEFTSDDKASSGDFFYGTIELASLAIPNLTRFKAQVEIKWYDSDRFRIGGTFLNLTPEQNSQISQIVDTLKNKKGHSL